MKNSRIAPTTDYHYKHTYLISKLNELCLDLKLAISGETGVPSTLIHLNSMKDDLTEILSPLSKPEILNFYLSDKSFEREIKSITPFFDKLIIALKEFKPIPFSSKEIDEFSTLIEEALKTFREPMVKY